MAGYNYNKFYGRALAEFVKNICKIKSIRLVCDPVLTEDIWTFIAIYVLTTYQFPTKQAGGMIIFKNIFN